MSAPLPLTPRPLATVLCFQANFSQRERDRGGVREWIGCFPKARQRFSGAFGHRACGIYPCQWRAVHTVSVKKWRAEEVQICRCRTEKMKMKSRRGSDDEKEVKMRKMKMKLSRTPRPLLLPLVSQSHLVAARLGHVAAIFSDLQFCDLDFFWRHGTSPLTLYQGFGKRENER